MNLHEMPDNVKNHYKKMYFKFGIDPFGFNDFRDTQMYMEFMDTVFYSAYSYTELVANGFLELEYDIRWSFTEEFIKFLTETD